MILYCHGVPYDIGCFCYDGYTIPTIKHILDIYYHGDIYEREYENHVVVGTIKEQTVKNPYRSKIKFWGKKNKILGFR